MAGSRRLRTALVVTALLVTAACESDDGPEVTLGRARAAVAAGTANPKALVGGSAVWTPTFSMDNPTISAPLVQECGEPRTATNLRGEGLVQRGSSEVWRSPQGWEDPARTEPPRGIGGEPTVRTDVLVYADVDAARDAFSTIDRAPFFECIVGVLHRDDIANDGEDDIDDPTVDDLDTAVHALPLGDEARLVEARFLDELYGGYDNEHAQELVIARSGPVIVTATTVSSSQAFYPEDIEVLRDFARDLAGTALDHATAALSE